MLQPSRLHRWKTKIEMYAWIESLEKREPDRYGLAGGQFGKVVSPMERRIPVHVTADSGNVTAGYFFNQTIRHVLAQHRLAQRR